MDRLVEVTADASSLASQENPQLAKLAELTTEAAKLAATENDHLRDFRACINHQLEAVKAMDDGSNNPRFFLLARFVSALDIVLEGDWNKDLKQRMFDQEEQFPKPKDWIKKQPKEDLRLTIAKRVPLIRPDNPPSAPIPEWEINYEELHKNFRDFVGEGAYAEVFTANWHGELVAVKRFRPFEKADENGIRAEIGILQQLNHPNILRFIGACLRFPNICLVTEYCSMGSVRGLLSNHDVDLNWVFRAQVARDVARALEYLHSQRIIHRDIKASNVLLDEHANVKVCDFGVAKIKEELKDTFLKEKTLRPPRAGKPFLFSSNPHSQWVGTTAWMAPELQLGHAYDESADIYSHGILMWELLTRGVPWKDYQDPTIFDMVQRGQRPSIPDKTDMPYTYIALMEQCWSGKPTERPPISEVARRLQDIIDVGNAQPQLTYRVPQTTLKMQLSKSAAD